MITYTVKFKGDHAQATAQIRKAVSAVSGKFAAGGTELKLAERVGNAILGVVSEAFEVKLHGGTDASGLKWQELSPVTIRKKKSDKILLEQGPLQDSLKPGIRAKYQVWRVRAGLVEVGTDRPFARRQHLGGKFLPQRRLWAETKKWPKAWWQKVAREGMLGVTDIILYLLR